MVNDKKEFYRRLAEDSLKNIKTKRTIKTTRTTGTTKTLRVNNNNYKTRNGMIKLENNENTQVKSKFFIQCIISLLIVGIFYYLSNSNSTMANNIIDKTKSIINMELNFDNKLGDLFSKFNIKSNNNIKRDNVSIDENIIEQMEEEIANAPKK
nr:hypothetical protein [uncultured Tyzzerella sp.]